MATLRIPTFEDIIYNFCNPRNADAIKDCVDEIKGHNVLQEFEKEVLETYLLLSKELKSTPSIAILQQSMPQFRCQSTIDIEDLLGSVKLFIKSRLNKQVSNQLLNVADQISKEGVTEEIADLLAGLTKTDANTKKYENITDKIDDIYNRTVDKSGIRTDTRKIDDYIGGLKPGQLSTIAAFTGSGKSTFAVCTMHSAIKQGFNVCYLSLELSADHLLYNLISRHSVDKDDSYRERFPKPVCHTDMKNKTLANGDWDYIKNTILPDLLKLPGKFYILDEQDLEAYTFFAFNNKLQEINDIATEETGHGIDLLIVDHIQMLQFSEMNSRANENTIINKWVNYFRGQCLDFLKTKRQIHVLMCAQINRQGYMRAKAHEGMYDLTALKEANEIETASSIIISLYSDPTLAGGKEIKFGILKNRDGIKSDVADTIYCDFAHQLIGGDGTTSDQEFAGMTMDDIVAAGKSDVDVGKIQQEMQLFEDSLPF